MLDRSSIQSTREWPTSKARFLILAIISLQAPRLNHVRFAVELVLYVDTSVLPYLEGVAVKASRRWPTHVVPVYVVYSAVAWAQDLALLLDPSHRTPQMSAVVAHNIQLWR